APLRRRPFLSNAEPFALRHDCLLQLGIRDCEPVLGRQLRAQPSKRPASLNGERAPLLSAQLKRRKDALPTRVPNVDRLSSVRERGTLPRCFQAVVDLGAVDQRVECPDVPGSRCLELWPFDRSRSTLPISPPSRQLRVVLGQPQLERRKSLLPTN